MTDKNVTNENNKENIDIVETVEKSTSDNPAVDINEVIPAEQTNQIPTVNYLDKKILEMKTISVDELKNYQTQKNIDDSIYDTTVLDIKQNRIVEGSVINITDKCVFVDIGFKSEGMIPKDEFLEMPNMNDQIKVYIKSFEDSKGNFILSKQKADFEIKWNEIREIFNNDGLIKGKIIKRIKGGMVVELGVVQGFLPGSQIEIYSVTDFDKYIDMECDFKIVKFNEVRKNIVLSRKELLNDEMTEKRQEILGQMEIGMVLEGMVKNITEFGAFIDLGGIDGLLHITDITWGRINHPSEKITLGEKVEVKVIDFDVKNVKISLGMKQLQSDPWENISDKFSVGSKVSGKVVNLMNYGLFLQLEEGIEGLIHISEMSWTKHIKHPSDVYSINDVVEATVISLDVEKKKIALGIKQLLENPWETIENKYPIGTKHEGIVKHFTQYGAFVELEEGIDGLLHISDISWTRLIKHPNEVFSIGEKIEIKILEVSSDERKLGVGTKQLQDDPLAKFSSGDTVNAKLVKILDKGLVFEVEDSVEGMVSFKDLNEDDREDLKSHYILDDSYDMTVSEVNHSMKKVMFNIDK
ncbi:MAG: 30S ribosomal protein S1 [Candidatus Marinimicrobia bacterium]|nr:30S ribosomal protein S1 [Candidatus Neomarinimicrobiota bacterium]